MSTLPEEYRHEPEMALASGADGMDAVRGILAGARQHLNPGGLLAVEVGHNRHLVEQAFPELELTWPEVEGGDDSVFVISQEQLPS
jgi:ribosomal protein L3 glutamine methyltransferase